MRKTASTDPASADQESSDCEFHDVVRRSVCRKCAEKMKGDSDGRQSENSPFLSCQCPTEFPEQSVRVGHTSGTQSWGEPSVETIRNWHTMQGKGLRVAKKRAVGRYPKAFRKMAVERLKSCENIVALSTSFLVAKAFVD